MKLKGITVGTYISKRPKGKFDESICASCENNKNKNIDKEKQYEFCKGCDKFYVSKTCKAILTTGRDQTTGQTQRKTFVADTEQEALDKALDFRINLNKNGGPRIITKTNKQYGLYEEASINSALKRAGLKLGIGLYEETNSKGKKVTRTDIHTHMLRGTFATRCAEAKIAPVVLKEILGHSDISITMKYYIDIDTDFIKAENKSVVNYLINKNIFGVIINKDDMAS